MTTNEEIRFRKWQESLAPKGSSRRNAPQESGDSIEDESLGPTRELQSEFIEKMDSGSSALAAYLREKIGLVNDQFGDTLELPRRLSAGEVLEPPIQLEQELHDAWTDLTPRQASQSLYWYRCHIRWLEEGKLADGPAASFSKKQPTPQLSQIKTNDDRTRDALRHMGGLAHVRGRVSVLEDCPLSRAWWKRRVADQAARVYRRLSVDQAHQALKVWPALAELLLAKVTIISHPQTQAALIAHLVLCREEGKNPTQAYVQQKAKHLAQHGLRFSIAFCSVDDLLSVLQEHPSL